MLDMSKYSYHFIIFNVMPAGMVVSASVDIRKLVPLPVYVVLLHPGPGYPLCATPHPPTSHHDCVSKLDAACHTEIMF